MRRSRHADLHGLVFAVAVSMLKDLGKATQMDDVASMTDDRALARRYRTLLEVSESIARHLDFAPLLDDLAARLPEVVEVNFIGLSLHLDGRQTMRLHTIRTNVAAEMIGGHEWPVAECPDGWVWQTQQPLLLSDVDRETRWPNVIGLMQQDGTRSLCMVPLTTAVRRLGAIGFGSLRPAAYREGDLEFLSQIGKQVAVAADNILHHDDLVRERDRLRLLLDINNSVVSTLDLRNLLGAVTDSLQQAVRHDRASLVLYEPALNQLRLYAGYGVGREWIQEGTLAPVDGTPGGLAFRSRTALVFSADDLKAMPSDVARVLAQEGVRSHACVPLLAHERALGALTLSRLGDVPFSPKDLDLLSQVASQIAIAVENALAYQEITSLKDKLAKEKLYLEEEIRTDNNFEDIVGESRALKSVLKQVEIVAPTDSTVLVLGETGTGKELIARAIHQLSGRRDRTFVKLNCAAIPTGLLESELFGHEKGAFTGAIAQKIGRFELADGGTLFLDEVGDIPLELQSKLLRVLQEQEFERLGSTRTIKVNVRLIGATNRDLAALVQERTFRSDLYYRLNVFPITLPPLRDRAGDIPILVRHFVRSYAARMGKTITTIPTAAMESLSRYPWPGNVRELENLIERAVILSPGHELHVPLAELVSPAPASLSALATLEHAEREHILRALEEANWRIGGPSGAAARLGMKRTTLNSKIKKLGISRRLA